MTTTSTDPDAAPETAQRLAVLLEAGIPPARSWSLLAEAGDGTAAAVAAAPAGTKVASVLAGRGETWSQIAIAWAVAETVGAPLASSLRRFAEALRDAQETRDDVDVALADPAATARLVGWLPLVAVGLGLVLGFDVVSVFTQPAGIAVLVAGAVLMLLARRWSARLVAAAQPAAGLPGLQADAVAIALSAGVSVDRALSVVASAGGGEASAETRAVLALAQRAGTPAVELLRATAAEMRRARRTQGRLRAARLGSRLLLPMGLCTLPAFLLLGVAPMLMSVLAGSTPILASP
ncbi:type II secretion system F family protein [Microbacterium flavum]|uniref:Type II secretion system F family protein n=1 Tax=Microbacterium flavum TaxID=415216 RepID=A0ABS5XWW5_9MICO|nr:type II secretion system F family protein [Microbacterium flavum]MBT8799024.1 type II secretion system F family protein [Microbacterium flavum]